MLRKRFTLFRAPNAELSALSLEIDLRALSVIEGLRAALGTAILVAVNQWLHWPLVNLVALGALLSCLCDVGGPMQRRLAMMLSFIAGGTVLFALFGTLRADLPWAVLPLAGLFLFAHAMARSWGQHTMQVGNLLSVVMIVAIDVPAPWHRAVITAGAFGLGGLWALVLTLVLWRLRPYQPARRAVGGVYRQLALLAEDMKALIDGQVTEAAAWDDHARAHRRSVREAIETARDVVDQLVRTRGPQSGATVQSPIRLEAADEIFGVLVGLSAVAENTPAARPGTARVLRLLAPLLRVMAETIEHDAGLPAAPVAQAIASIGEIAGHEPLLAGVLGELAERLHLAVSVAGAVKGDVDPADLPFVPHPWWERVHDRLVAELSWSSAILRHALRTVLLAGGAIAASMAAHQYYAHWLTITLVLTLQPFFANTRIRAIERTLGTFTGVLLVTGLAAVLHSPLAVAGALVPVTVVAFALRRVSFTLFISGLTPFVILLIELGHQGTSAGAIALQRLVYSFAGGVFAVVGNRFLWPLWEPVRLREALAESLRVHAAWLMADKSDDLARRRAGRSSNALETSLARALGEPHGARDRSLDLALVIDAALRRMGGHLTALALQSRHPPDLAWRGWAAENLRAMAGEGSMPARPDTAVPEGLVPIVRQVELMVGASGRKGEESSFFEKKEAKKL